MIRTLAAALLLAPTLAGAQTASSDQTRTVQQTATDRQAETGRPPQRIRDVELAANQPCPQSSADEVVVCHRNTEPYRIPKALRDEGSIPANRQSWVNRSAEVDQVSRVAGGLPDTCSPVGTGGQSGCALQGNQQWAAEQRARRAEAAALPNASAASVGDTRGVVTQP